MENVLYGHDELIKNHRLVYEVFEEEKRVELLSAYGHYNDD